MSSFRYSGNVATYTPSSSPPSSPSSAYVNSSSPPSSPVLDAFTLESDHDHDSESTSGRTASSSTLFDAPMDPLAGSYHVNRTRKRDSYTFLNSPPKTSQKKARYANNASLYVQEEQFQPSKLYEDELREKMLWEDAIEAVFVNGERKINLTNCNISHIPSNILQDLGKMVVLPESGEPYSKIQSSLSASASSSGNVPGRRLFTRIHTAPPSMSLGWARTNSDRKIVSKNSVLGISRETMDVILARNNISKLPVELWNLHNLTVLSLRNNNITYLPPQIAQLKELQSLNIAHNKLRFIPAELIKMKKLTQLLLFPNPFIHAPPTNGLAKSVSEIVFIGSRVPSLAELALRILLAPPDNISAVSPRGTFTTTLEKMYELPLPTGQSWRPLSGTLQSILSVCVPGSVIAEENNQKRWDDDDGSKEITGIGLCPNPAHDSSSGVYVQHAEERYTWETSTPLIPQLGGSAAVLWRGCLRGCLEFLTPVEAKANEVVEGQGTDHEEELFEPVQFAIAPLGFD